MVSGLDASPAPAGEVRIAGIVLKWLRCDKDANLERGEKLIREAAANGAQIVATSECFLDGYMSEESTLPLRLYRDLAEPVPHGPCCRRLSALAAELKTYLAVGMTERDGNDCYNSAVLIGPEGEHVGTYRKEKLSPCDELRNKAGDGAGVFETKYGRIGMRICYDRAHPEIVKATCDAGADFVILLCGGIYGEKNTCMVQARARDNGRHMVFVHPVQFFAVRPDGTVFAAEQFGGTCECLQHYDFPLMSVHGAVRGMVISTEQIGTDIDCNGVGYCDLPLRSRCVEDVTI